MKWPSNLKKSLWPTRISWRENSIPTWISTRVAFFITSACSLSAMTNALRCAGLIYKAMGFPTDYFPVLFMIPRTVGWLAHWCGLVLSLSPSLPPSLSLSLSVYLSLSLSLLLSLSLFSSLTNHFICRLEFLEDPENRIVRPRQVYLGSG